MKLFHAWQPSAAALISLLTMGLGCNADDSRGALASTSAASSASMTTMASTATGSGSTTEGGSTASTGALTTTAPTSSETTDSTSDGTTTETTTRGSDSGTTGLMTGTGSDTGTTMGLSGGTGTTGAQDDPLWLLSIDNDTDWLQVVDIFTGQASNLCQLQKQWVYPSLTFNRDNRLFASRGGQSLDEIDPCTCQIEQVGDYGVFTQVRGITSDHSQGLYGVASGQDVVIAIDPDNGVAMQVGAGLGFNFGTNGATWSDTLDDLYAIDGTSDDLYIVDDLQGTAAMEANLSVDFGTVGIELHPFTDVIYACSSAPATLYEVDPMTGDTIPIGFMGQLGNCTNLAAPFKTVACIENP